MRNRTFTFLLTLFSLSVLSQSYSVRGKVTESGSGEAMPFVNITVNGTRNGTATDIDGKFQYTSAEPVRYLDFSFIGFEKKRVKVEEADAFLSVQLTVKSAELAEATVIPGENPAHRIIENAEKHRKLNDPYHIPAFSYKTYSKFILSVNTDSVDPSIDTVKTTVKDSTWTRLDSSNYKLVELMNKQHLFFMESVTERNYLAPSRDNETVLASRVSGFKNPLFSLLATQIQSFTFYDDYIEIAGNEYLNPITPGSTSRYFFILEDTVYNAPGDSVFIISFRPRPNYGFQPMKGLLYINSTDWAVQSAIAEPYENEGIKVTIEQQYRRYGEHTWFPVQLNAEIALNNLRVNNATPYGVMRTYLKDVSLNAPLKRKDISRADMTIAENAVDNAEIILNRYRIDSLSSKETETYRVIDSVSKAENFERGLKILTTLSRGKIPLWWVDLEIDKLFRYNVYEGFRLGAGGHTNTRFSDWFRVGGYFAYGFRDQVWKYGWDSEISLHKHSNLKLTGGYRFDIFETGGIDFLQKYNAGLLNDNYRILYIPQWDEVTRYHGGITYDIMPKLHGEVRLQRENRLTIGDYYFSYTDTENTVLRNGFNYTELITSLRYSPNEKYIEGPEFGKIIYDIKYPIIYLQYTRGIDELLGSHFEYDKIDARIEYQYKTVRAGTFSLSAQAGAVLDNLPFSKLYVGTSNMVHHHDFWERALNIADRNSFETMRYNEFLSDRYFQLFFRQDLKSLLFRREKFAPHIEIVSRAIWGGLRTPELHENISFKTPRKGFYESGLELNRLYSGDFYGIGLGFYYRYGAYSLPQFSDNFAVKITSKFRF